MVGWWTICRVLASKNKQNSKEYQHDNQNIPFTNYGAPMGESGKVDVEGGQFVTRPPYYTEAYYPQENIAGYQR